MFWLWINALSNRTTFVKAPQMSERRSNTICAVVERPDRHCGDDLVSSDNKNKSQSKLGERGEHLPSSFSLTLASGYPTFLVIHAKHHSCFRDWSLFFREETPLHSPTDSVHRETLSVIFLPPRSWLAHFSFYFNI